MHVNDRAQLAAAEAELRARINLRWMREGVSMVDPDRDLRRRVGRARARRAPAARHDPRGPHRDQRRLGRRSRHPARRHDRRRARACIRQTVAREAEIGDDCTVGPYVSLRPGTRLAAGAHVGTFVETKNAEIGEGAKVPAPLVRRRRRDRRPGEHRRRDDHGQLRRHATSTARWSAPTPASRRTRCWSRRSRSATARTRVPAPW